jgi:hypothetical protein
MSPKREGRMKVTGTNHEPEKYGKLWWGDAIDGDDKLEWFYEPRLFVRFRREERPSMWVNIYPTPPAAKRAVLKAIRAAKEGMKCD